MEESLRHGNGSVTLDPILSNGTDSETEGTEEEEEEEVPQIIKEMVINILRRIYKWPICRPRPIYISCCI